MEAQQQIRQLFMFMRIKSVFLAVIYLLLLTACGGDDMGYGVELTNNDNKVILSDSVEPLMFHSKIVSSVTRAPSSLSSLYDYEVVNTGLSDQTNVPYVVSNLAEPYKIVRLFFDATWKIEYAYIQSGNYDFYIFQNTAVATSGDMGMVLYREDQTIAFSSTVKYFQPIAFAELNTTESELAALFNNQLAGQSPASIDVLFDRPVTAAKIGANFPFLGRALASGGTDTAIFQTRVDLSLPLNKLSISWEHVYFIPFVNSSGMRAINDLTQSIPLIDLSLYD